MTEYIKGLEVELKKLEELPKVVQRRVVQGALRAGANVIRKRAIMEAPVGRGRNAWKQKSIHLKQTIRVSAKSRGKDVRASVKIGDRNKGVFYGHMVIGGTKPHLISPKRGKGLSFGGRVRQTVNHPGTQPNPFLDRANKAAGREAVQAVFSYADERIKREFSQNVRRK